MCQGGGDLGEFLKAYPIIRQDNRVIAELGRGLGWDGLTEEAKKNQQNPGAGLTKAAGGALSWYLGGLLGGAGEAGAGASQAGAGVADVAAGQVSPEMLAQYQSFAPDLLSQQAPMYEMAGGGSDKMSLALRGLQMMQPQRPQAAPMGGGRPMPQGQPSALPSPYGMDALSGNLPPPGMSYEEWLKRKQMMGGGNV